MDWPIEAVACQLVVVAPRELTVLEWACARVLDEFPQAPPTLVETADELGLADPVWLSDALQSLVEQGTVAVRAQGGELDLAHSQLTDSGRQMLAKGRIEGIPARYGREFYFDALTGEHIPKLPKEARDEAEHAVVAAERLPARMDSIGLDRVRELARAKGDPACRGASQIRQVEVAPEGGKHLWAPVRVLRVRHRDGKEEVKVEGFSARQQEWFDRHGSKLATPRPGERPA